MLIADVNRADALDAHAPETLGGHLIEPDSVLDVVQHVRCDLGLALVLRFPRIGFRIRAGLLLDAAQEVHLALDAVHRDDRLAASQQDLLLALIPLAVIIVVIPVAVAVRELARLRVRLLGVPDPPLIGRNALALELGLGGFHWLDGS